MLADDLGRVNTSSGRRPFWRFRRQRRRVVVYRATVRLSYRGLGSLSGGEDVDVTADDYERIKGGCIEALQNDLPRECESIGLPVSSVRFNRADRGSLELLFTTVWDFVQTAGDVAAFYDAVRLAGALAERLLERAALADCGRKMRASASCDPVLPSRESLRDGCPWNDMRPCGKRAACLGGGGALRTAVVCLSAAVIVLAAVVAWLACGMANL